MSMFPELVAPIQTQLNAAEAELRQLEESCKAKKKAVRGLKRMLRDANGDGAARRSTKAPKAARS